MFRSIILPQRAVDILKESEWNFHHSKSDSVHTRAPYVSDSKYKMLGRGTGHFGSGTYFSTYKNIGDEERFKDVEPGNGEFIRVANNVYRVDMDLYKNLYRVYSRKQGSVLFTMCRYLNAFYNRITTMGDFVQSQAYYANSDLYQLIKSNADALGLGCPSYLKLTRMAQTHEGAQSFSTLFMEWNGYNGVNVSGVEGFDNDLHGSVIYDLSKVSSDVKEIKPKGWFFADDKSTTDSVVYNPFEEYEVAALRGKDSFWPSKLCDMPVNQALRILKNYTKSRNVLDGYYIEKMRPQLLDRYLRMLYHSDAADGFVESRDFYGIISKANAWWFAGYKNGHVDAFLNLCSAHYDRLDWGMPDEEMSREMKKFITMLEGKMDREIDEDEQYYIQRNYLSVNDENDEN